MQQDIFRGGVGSQSLANLAKSQGLDPAQVSIASRLVFDALAHRIERATLSRSGLADLVEIIGAPGRDVYLQPTTPLDAPQVRADGIGILSQLLGSKDQSRALAARVAKHSQLTAPQVEALLPSLAALLLGALSQRTKLAFGDILKIPGLDEIAKEARDDLGGGGQLAPPQYGSPLPLPGEPPFRPDPGNWTGSAGRAGAPTSTPANQKPAAQPPVETPSGRSGKAPRSPLPLPGDDVPGMGRHEDNPYGDLTDILRRGGFRLPGGVRIPGGNPGSGRPHGAPGPTPGSSDLPSQGGGLLETIIRNVLGNVLGYQPRGIIGWIVRLIVMRWGWNILRSILRRVLGINI